jgi:hypothetical protein
MIPRMAKALTSSSSIPLLETIESILCTTTSDPEFGADGVENYTQAKYLDSLGFSALMKGGMDTMSRETKMIATHFAGEVAGSILSVWNAPQTPI